MSWATFIKAHLGVVVGMDFFTVEAVTWLRLIRYHVLFAIDIASSKVEILGIAVNPGGLWMEQMARNLVDALDGFLLGKRYLLLDRDPLYTQAFRQILDQAGVKTVRLPAHLPNLNASAERFVLSIKSECLERLVPLGERHLRLAISEYLRRYHFERNHQGLANAPERRRIRGRGWQQRGRLPRTARRIAQILLSRSRVNGRGGILALDAVDEATAKNGLAILGEVFETALREKWCQ